MTISVRVITREASAKMARAAFELASTRRRKLDVIYKDTVFKLGCGMFAEECRGRSRLISTARPATGRRWPMRSARL